MILVLVNAIIIIGFASASPNCDTFKTCAACTSTKSWTESHCRWCPKTKDCHAEGSMVNKCSIETQITDAYECSMVESTAPSQIHIALAGPQGMAVSYTTLGQTTTTVSFGESAATLKAVSGASSSYIEPFFHHHTVLKGLKAATKYYYRCGDSAAGQSEVLSFTTPPDPSQHGSFSASVFGDWGYGKDGHAIATRTALENIRHKVNMVWHLGDIGYADDAFMHDATGFEYENVYNSWMEWIANISTTLPYLVAPGNHESECHSPACLGSPHIRNALANFSAYNARWRMPSPESGGVANMWYSFDYGFAHFISINSETDFKGAGEEKHGDSGVIPAGGFGRDGQYLEWLERDLANANASRATRPWIFAGGHRPLYTGAATDPIMQKAVEHLFMIYDVDIYFSGHIHSYARSLPVFDSVVEPQKNTSHYVDPTKPVHVLVGGAGCDEMKVKEVTAAGEEGEAEREEEEAAAWNVYADSQYGTGILRVIDRNTAQWQYIHSETMEVADEFYITKSWH